jgi:SAM-dependent methyltransferase
MTEPYESGSFRDRNARVFVRQGSVFRGLNPQASAEWDALAATRFFRDFSADGRMVATEQVAAPDEAVDTERWTSFLRHERIPFVSYPYEWCFGMLQTAALLHLDLLLAALDEEMILKDSSAYNMQWVGASPVFIDIASFERLTPGEPWVGYRQFCEMFLFPLMLQAYKDVPFHAWMRGNLDGIEPAHCAPLFSLRDMLRPGVLKHLVLQAKLEARYGGTERNVRDDLRKAGFAKELIVANAKGLRKLVSRLQWRQSGSEWADYVDCGHYEAADQQKKADFVRQAVSSQPRSLVWDLGCNTGTFSRIAAESADYVVAQDGDHLAIERLWRELAAEGNRKILPLVNNVADPSPALGWRGRERQMLAQRGAPDLVLCLALVHHMVLTANVPLREFIDWLASLGGDLVIEFVTKEDPMVKTLLRNKDDNYDDYDETLFEQWLGESFEIERREPLCEGRRIMYHARARG